MEEDNWQFADEAVCDRLVDAAIKLEQRLTWAGAEIVQLTIRLQAMCCAFHRSRFVRRIRRRLIPPNQANVRKARNRLYPAPRFVWRDPF